MTSYNRPTLGLTLFGAFLISTSLSAEALTVGRCNALVDGVYVPVLVVQNGDQQTIHQIGIEGLTRRIVFDPAAAIEWAATVYGSAAAETEYSDKCHLAAGGSGGATLPPPPPPPPPPEDDGEDDGCGPTGNDSVGGGDGCGPLFNDLIQF